jgi:single-strand DNA-binding protein
MAAVMTELCRLGRDAEIRYLPNGAAVATLSLCYQYGRKREGEQYPPSQWIEAGLWDKQAENLTPFLKKGRMAVFTFEDVHTEEFTRQDQTKGYKLAARVQSVRLIPDGNRQGDEAGRSTPPAGAAAPAPRQAPRQAPPPRPSSGFDDMDDDIPFRDPLAYRGAHWVL